MNWPVLVAGVFASLATLGHFAVGSKNYLRPTLQASLEEVPKKVMHCLFHYVSAYMILSAIFLLAFGFGVKFQGDTTLLIRFVALNYAAFAIVQIIIALSSKIERAPLKLFQWIFWVIIALLSWFGA